MCQFDSFFLANNGCLIYIYLCECFGSSSLTERRREEERECERAGERNENRNKQKKRYEIKYAAHTKIQNYASVTGNVLRSAAGRGCNLIVAKKNERNGDPKKAALHASSISAGALSNTRSIGIETTAANPEAQALDAVLLQRTPN